MYADDNFEWKSRSIDLQLHIIHKYTLTKNIFNLCQINANTGEILNLAYCQPQRIY